MALIADVGALLDEGLPDQPYVSAIRALQESIDQPDRTPSARVLHDMEANNETFYQFGRRMAEQHRQELDRRPLSPDTRHYLEEVSDESLRQTSVLESETNESFEAYVAGYLAGYPDQWVHSRK